MATLRTLLGESASPSRRWYDFLFLYIYFLLFRIEEPSRAERLTNRTIGTVQYVSLEGDYYTYRRGREGLDREESSNGIEKENLEIPCEFDRRFEEFMYAFAAGWDFASGVA